MTMTSTGFAPNLARQRQRHRHIVLTMNVEWVGGTIGGGSIELPMNTLTDAYHFQASYLIACEAASYSGSLSQQTVAQHIGLQRLINNNDSLHHLSSSTLQHNSNAQQVEGNGEDLLLDYQAAANTVHCNTCGVWLQPGWLGTTLRVRRIERGRTRRRRANRIKKRHFQRQELSAKEIRPKPQGSGILASVVANNGTMNRPPNASDATKRLQFAQCRNVVAIRCGTCQSTTKQPGVKRKRLPGKEAPKAASVKVTKASKVTTNRPITKQAKGDAVDNMDTDFIPLTAASADSRPIKAAFSLSAAAAAASSHQQPQAPTLLSSSKKKRKKKAEPPASKLLNFLSSLND